MRLQRQSNQESVIIQTASPLGAGGEARVFAALPDGRLVAKIYHRPDRVHARKLAVMMSDPPDDPLAGQGHISITWPVDLLYTAEGVPLFVGYLMPRVSGMLPLFNCYNPQARRQHWPLFDYLYLHRTARNLA